MAPNSGNHLRRLAATVVAPKAMPYVTLLPFRLAGATAILDWFPAVGMAQTALSGAKQHPIVAPCGAPQHPLVARIGVALEWMVIGAVSTKFIVM